MTSAFCIRSLHVIDRVGRSQGGAMQAMFSICKFLVARNHHVLCVASTEQSDDVSHLCDEFGEVRTMLFSRSWPLRYANSRQLCNWLKGNLNSFDIIEIHAIFSVLTWRTARICRAAGKPYLIRPHGSLDRFDLKKHAWLKQLIGPLFVRPMIEGSAAVLLTAPREAESLVTYGAMINKVVMPLPVSLSCEHGDGVAFRSYHGIPEDAQVVLFLSRLDYKKGLSFLIPALAKLKANFSKLWFVMAGAGSADFTFQVHEWLNQYKVRSFTSEVGFVSGQTKLDAFAAADIFALPSLNENFGIVNIEAMHAGLPLLISEEVYISDEIQEAGAGVICTTSVASVSNKLVPMLDGTIDLKGMGQRGRALVKSKYRPEVTTDKLVDLYAEVLEQHRLGRNL